MKKPNIFSFTNGVFWRWWCTVSCEYLFYFNIFLNIGERNTITHRARWKMICRKKPGVKNLYTYILRTIFWTGFFPQRHFLCLILDIFTLGLHKDRSVRPYRVFALFGDWRPAFKTSFWVSIRTYALCLHWNICFGSQFEHLLWVSIRTFAVGLNLNICFGSQFEHLLWVSILTFALGLNSNICYFC